MRRCHALWPAITVPLLAGCNTVQSSLHPAGPESAAVWMLGNVMYAGAAVIFVLVLALTGWAILARPGRRRWLGGRHLVVGGGIAFPVVVLSALLVYGLGVARSLTTLPDPTVRIEVTGEQFWWRISYLGERDRPDFASANEVRIPAGEPVEFVLKAADVIHSFWAPTLAGKLDMIPGRVNRLVLRAERPGVYRGQCAEYCGAQHALMAFDVIVEEPEAYRAWTADQRRPAAEPTDPSLQRGRELFVSNGCGACHTIRGTEAAGVIGPDLTHVGSRRTIAASTLPNNAGALAAWIAGSQHLKPGNLMPSFDTLSGEDLSAVAAYLESLR